MDRDTIAKLRSGSVKIKKEDSSSKTLIKKLEPKNEEQSSTIKEQAIKIKQQDVKIKELNAENKRLVAARSEARAYLGRDFGGEDFNVSFFKCNIHYIIASQFQVRMIALRVRRTRNGS